MRSDNMLSGPSILPKSSTVHKAVIFLHGYGASGDDLISIGRQWSKDLPDTLFVAPDAPFVCDVNPHGRQWFPLQTMTPIDIRKGVDHVFPIIVRYVNKLIAEHNIHADNVYIVGFSQGAMLALESVFSDLIIGGVISYSGAFFAPIVVATQPLYHTPALLVHGTEDTVVPYDLMIQTQLTLVSLGVNVKTISCPGLGHTIDNEGLAQGLQFIKTLEQQHAKIGNA